MEKISLQEIARATGGTIRFGGENLFVDSVVIDSRKVQEGSLFVGMAGARVNGNDYVANAFSQGAAIAIIDEAKKVAQQEGKGLIQVASSRQAMLDLARYYKNRTLKAVEFIAVTGSVGKTSTKDLLHGMLSRKYRVYKTSGNYNNELGLPLTLFAMDASYDLAVLEMGMSARGEIHQLADLTRPNRALITNIGSSHLEILKTRENILLAKMEITDFFGPEQTLYLNADDPYLQTVEKPPYRLVRAGLTAGEYTARNLRLGAESISFALYQGTQHLGELTLPMPGAHNVANAVLAFACAHDLGIEPKDLEHFTLERTKMRLEVLRTSSLTVINDAYNASPESAKAGLRTLAAHKGRKVAMFGDMRELGEATIASHQEVGALARTLCDVFIAIGDQTAAYRDGFGPKDFHGFPSVESALTHLPKLLQPGDVVYLKASRASHFEQLIPHLERI
ncbi:UDP-N-acetylmuramoyl-tripeptide--D-alanyl-D- alanine ligase [Clostridiaceae bacterium JG1575]|nr:UDP-N-acetylmuramoyl-tripeptide--D-alanyl-D- alanine ligase [Clostridiaceae bacterium JG1575]